MEVYKSKYLHVAFFAEQSLMEATWQSETKMIYTEECQQELLNYLDAVCKHRPRRVIWDVRTMFFTYTPKMQDWIDQRLFTPSFDAGLRWVAFVVGDDFFVELSTKQAMNENKGRVFISQYFDSKETAKSWLLSVG